MVVPSDPKPSIVITNKKLYYVGAVVTWLGVIPTLASTYAQIKFVQMGSFTPEFLLNKALLICGVIVSIFGLMMVNKARKMTEI